MHYKILKILKLRNKSIKLTPLSNVIANGECFNDAHMSQMYISLWGNVLFYPWQKMCGFHSPEEPGEDSRA